MKVEHVKEAYKLLRNAEYLENFAEQIVGQVYLTQPGYNAASPATGPQCLAFSESDAPFIRRALKEGAIALVAAAKELGVEE